MTEDEIIDILQDCVTANDDGEISGIGLAARKIFAVQQPVAVTSTCHVCQFCGHDWAGHYHGSKCPNCNKVQTAACTCPRFDGGEKVFPMRECPGCKPAAAVEPRPCTCHPDDNPPIPCAQKYAYAECIASVRPAADAGAGKFSQADLDAAWRDGHVKGRRLEELVEESADLTARILRNEPRP